MEISPRGSRCLYNMIRDARCHRRRATTSLQTLGLNRSMYICDATWLGRFPIIMFPTKKCRAISGALSVVRYPQSQFLQVSGSPQHGGPVFVLLPRPRRGSDAGLPLISSIAPYSKLTLGVSMPEQNAVAKRRPFFLAGKLQSSGSLLV